MISQSATRNAIEVLLQCVELGTTYREHTEELANHAINGGGLEGLPHRDVDMVRLWDQWSELSKIGRRLIKELPLPSLEDELAAAISNVLDRWEKQALSQEEGEPVKVTEDDVRMLQHALKLHKGSGC